MVEKKIKLVRYHVRIIRAKKLKEENMKASNSDEGEYAEK